MREIYQYKTADGGLPVKRFIEGLDTKSAKKILCIIEMIKNGQLALKEPYVRAFRTANHKGFYEIRIKIIKMIRIIFCVCDSGDIILLYAFFKTHNRATEKALEAAKQILIDIKGNSAVLALFNMRGAGNT
jgi:phage-related protein